MEQGLTKTKRKHGTDRIGTERVGKLLLEFSIPAIIAMIFNALYNVVDSIFLGQAVGTAGIAVTTLAMPLMIVLMGCSMIAGQGGNALAAIMLGERKIERVEHTLGNTFTLLLVISALIALVSWLFIDPLLALVGTTSELYAQTKIFIRIISFGFVFQCVGMGLNNFLRTAGKPNLALFTGVFGTLVCIALNYLFVMMLGWGIAGSAIATISGQACGMIPVILYFARDRRAPFRLHVRYMKPDFALQGKILMLGVASFAMQVAAAVLNVILNHMLVRYGALDAIGSEGALSAIGVASKVVTFAIMPVIGVTMGAQPLIGYNYGAHYYARVKDTLWKAVLFASGIIVFFFALIHLIPVQIVNLFGVSGDLETFTVFALQAMSIMFPVVGFQVTGSSYFQSSGQPLKAAVLGLTRQVLFLIPLLLILPHALPVLFSVTSLQSICFAYPCADVLSASLTAFFIFREMRRLKGLPSEEDEASGDLTGHKANLMSAKPQTETL